jgi:arylformamidase
MADDSRREVTGMLQIGEIVDLSHELYDGMSNLGGNPVSFGPIFSFASTRAMSAGRLAQEFKLMVMPEHCGTHFDAPSHFDEDGLSAADYPLERLILPGHLLDLTHKQRGEEITVGDLEQAEERSGRPIAGGSATIVWTGADAYRGQEGYESHRPFVPVAPAEWLLRRRVTLFATDLIGIDDPAEWWWPTHELWLKAGLPMVQQLCNLDRLVDKEFLFVALPLKMRHGTGSPVRAVAIVLGRD